MKNKRRINNRHQWGEVIKVLRKVSVPGSPRNNFFAIVSQQGERKHLSFFLSFFLNLMHPVHSGIPGRSGVASRRRCYSRGRVTHRPGRLPPPPPPPPAGALLSLVEGTRRSYVLALAPEMTEGRGLSPYER